MCAIAPDETAGGVGHTQTAHLQLRFRDSQVGSTLAKLDSAYQKIESLATLLYSESLHLQRNIPPGFFILSKIPVIVRWSNSCLQVPKLGCLTYAYAPERFVNPT